VLSRRGVSVALVQPVVNNPTGRSLYDDRLDALAKVFNRRRLPVVEDNVRADPRFDGRGQRRPRDPVPDRAYHDHRIPFQDDRGGLRVGWVRAPDELAAEIRRRIVEAELGMSAPSQLLAEQVLRSICSVLAHRRAELTRTATLLRNRPPLTFHNGHTTSRGGLSLWVRLPVRDSTTFVDSARLYGVDIVPGRVALAGRQLSSHIPVL
jgi:DNA-binding transcriptional MocR family regulator